MTDRELMQMALDALEHHTEMTRPLVSTNETIKALRAALAQPEHKPADVFLFLLGEGELDGAKFGERHPTERGNYWWRKHLRAVLAQPEPEPVAWRQWVEGNPKLRGHWMLADPDVKDKCLPQGDWQPLYTAPPQREWQGLTEDEVQQLFGVGKVDATFMEFTRAIEAKLKEKNT